jgi:D-xylose transport system substrate-binding protein
MNLFRFFLFGLLLISSTGWSQKIGWLIDGYTIDRWYKDDKYFIEKIKELGGEVIHEIPHGDADEQVKLGLKLIESKVDALVIIPIDAQKAATIVAAAKKANIPVIAYDRLIPSKDLSFYVSYDNAAVGQLQAEYALKHKPQGNYLLLNGPVADNNAILFREGQLSKIKPAVDAGKIKIIGDIVLNSWSEMEAMMKMEDFLAGSKVKPDAIVAANDAAAMGTIQILPKELLGKTVITGQDADLGSLRHIVSGEQSMTIYKPIKPLAYIAAEVTMRLVKKQPIANATKLKSGSIEVPCILLKPVVVDKSNYKETVVKDGHVELSELERQ